MPSAFSSPILDPVRWFSSIGFGIYNLAQNGQVFGQNSLPEAVLAFFELPPPPTWVALWWHTTELVNILLIELVFSIQENPVTSAAVVWVIYETGRMIRKLSIWIKDQRRKARSELRPGYTHRK